MSKIRLLAGYWMLIITGFALAADPVSWKLTKPFPATVDVNGGSYTAIYTFTNQLPMPVSILKTASPIDEFTFEYTCGQGTINARSSCTLTITLNPSVPGVKSYQLTIKRGNTLVPLPPVNVTATGTSNVKIEAEVKAALPASMKVGDSAPYRFLFHNAGTANATGVSVAGSYVDFRSNCGQVLNAGDHCEGFGSYTPVSINPSKQTVSATFSFGQGKPVSIETSTTVEDNPPLEAKLKGVLKQGLPGIAQKNMDFPFHFQFINEGNQSVNITSKQLPELPSQFYTIESNTCPNNNQPLQAEASCDVKGNFRSATNGKFTISTELIPQSSPPNPVKVSTSTEIKEGVPVSRTINFVNECEFPVRFSLNGGLRMENNTPRTCTFGGNECPNSCSAQSPGEPGQCFWENFAPEDNIFTLDVKGRGRSNYITVTDSGDNELLWAGTISASTGCKGNSCVTAYCENGNDNKACSPGVSFSKPSTQVAIVLNKHKPDEYDIDVVNGFHIPLQVVPEDPDKAGSDGSDSGSGYFCGSPGSPVGVVGSAPFGACRWDKVPNLDKTYYWVTKKGTPCTSDSQCPQNLLCGFDSDMNQSCGKFLGYWTANGACNAFSKGSARNEVFNCNASVNNDQGTPFPQDTKLTQLYGCQTSQDGSDSILNSCYGNDANDRCCGCVNWREPPFNLPPYNIQIPPPEYGTKICVNHSPAWGKNNPDNAMNGKVLKTVYWLKQTCPSYKVYPFDNTNSTFHCTGSSPDSPGVNTQEYTIRFCAGTISGSLRNKGKLDGRDGS